MPLLKTTIALAALSALAAPGFAQDGVTLEDLKANRISVDQVNIAFNYQGGACEEVGPAEVGELVDGTLSVTFPTSSTAEMCTMQAVQIEVDQAVEADHIVSRVDVMLLRPDGTPAGTGSTDLTPN